jgi:hypothetical protein
MSMRCSRRYRATCALAVVLILAGGCPARAGAD